MKPMWHLRLNKRQSVCLVDPSMITAFYAESDKDVVILFTGGTRLEVDVRFYPSLMDMFSKSPGDTRPGIQDVFPARKGEWRAEPRAEQ